MKISTSFVLDTEKTNLKHNNREMTDKEKEKNDHIDFDRSDKNKYLIQHDLDDFYKQEFGEAIENYNKKQKRADRKINNYYEHIKSGNKTASQQELIIQFGDIDLFKISENNREVMVEMLELYLESFQERNPNLKVYNAVIHDDEASPHLHLNFVPVADGYKTGLEKQVSFNRALNQQSNELDVDRPFMDWRKQEVNEMGRLLELEFTDVKRKEVGTNYFLDVNEYKKAMRERANDHEYIKVLDDLKNAQKLNLELQKDSKEAKEEKLALKIKNEEQKEALKQENESLKLQKEEQKELISKLEGNIEYYKQNILTLYNTARDYMREGFEDFKEWFREDVGEQGYVSELDEIEKEYPEEINKDMDMDM